MHAYDPGHAPHPLLTPGLPNREIAVAQEGPLAHLEDAAAGITATVKDFGILHLGFAVVFGGLDIDPVAHYTLTHTDPKCQSWVYDFDTPFFRDLPAPWDRRLHFVPQLFWPELLKFLQGVAMLDRRRHRYGRIAPEVCGVADWPRAKPLQPPLIVPITYLAVDMADGMWLAQSASAATQYLAAPVRTPARMVTRLQAAAIFGSDSRVECTLAQGRGPIDP